MPKKAAKPKVVAASNNAAAASGNAESLLESRISGLSIQIPKGNKNAIINPATGLPFNANHQNSSAAASSISQLQQASESSVSRSLGPIITTGSLLPDSDQLSAHRNADESSNRRTTSTAISSYRNEGLSPRHATSAAANHSANRNANHNANHHTNRNVSASDPAAVSMLRPVSGPLKTDAEIDATIIHPHHLELKNDWSETFKNDGLVPYCDVCGRSGMGSTYRCNGINCVYDECETCHSASHLRLRQQLPDSILPVFKIASDIEIINKLSLTPHRNDTMIAELRLREWKPNEIRRCDICNRLALKSYYCEDHNYDECVYCRTIFSGKQAHINQFKTLERQLYTKRQVNQNKVNRQYQQRIAQLGRGRHSKRSTHRKKANRKHKRTHKRSARR